MFGSKSAVEDLANRVKVLERGHQDHNDQINDILGRLGQFQNSNAHNMD